MEDVMSSDDGHDIEPEAETDEAPAHYENDVAEDATDVAMAEAGVAPLPTSLRPDWQQTVSSTLAAANLTAPESAFAHKGGRTGFQHTEHLGHMLATMQILPRSYPGAAW